MKRNVLGIVLSLVTLGVLTVAMAAVFGTLQQARGQLPAQAPTPTSVAKPISTPVGNSTPTPSPVPLDAATLRIASEKDLGQFSGYAAWSPDGKLLAFTKFAQLLKSPDDKVRQALHDLWVVGADGSNPRLLAKNAMEPTWSADGKKVYFNSFVAPGGDPRQLLKNLETYAINPDASGKKLVSNAIRRGALLEAETVQALPGGRIGILAGGRRMALLDGETGNTLQEIAEVDFGAYAEPKDTPLVGGLFSPDGSRMAYVGRDGTLWSLDLAGKTASKLAEQAKGRRSVAWSPDSSRLAFSNAKDELWTSRADGLESKKVLDFNSVAGPLDKDMGAGAPAWSPDGAVIFFSYSRNTRVGWDTYVVNASGGAGRLLSNSRAIISVPRPGNVVAFFGYDIQPGRLVIATLASGGQQR